LTKGDPWIDQLKNLDIAANAGNNIVKVADHDGKPEWRVSTYYLLVTVLGLAPESANADHQRRLARAMRRLGWAGPKNMRFEGVQARGFYRTAEDAGAAAGAGYARSA
jgi:hypothetical protein